MHTASTNHDVQSRGSHLELTSLHLELERIPGSARPHGVSTPCERPTDNKKEATTSNALETIQNASKNSDSNCDCQGIEQEQLQPGRTLEDDEVSIASTLHEVIADESKSEIEKALATLQDLVEKLLSNPSTQLP